MFKSLFEVLSSFYVKVRIIILVYLRVGYKIMSVVRNLGGLFNETLQVLLITSVNS